MIQVASTTHKHKRCWNAPFMTARRVSPSGHTLAARGLEEPCVSFPDF
jgi:hypothetical protein